MRRTLDRLAVERRRNLAHRLRDRPVLVADLDKAHRSLSSRVRRLDHVRLPARHGLVRRRTHDEGLGADRREAVDVRADMQLDDVALCERLLGRRVRRERREVRDAVVHGDRRREGETCRGERRRRKIAGSAVRTR